MTSQYHRVWQTLMSAVPIQRPTHREEPWPDGPNHSLPRLHHPRNHTMSGEIAHYCTFLPLLTWQSSAVRKVNSRIIALPAKPSVIPLRAETKGHVPITSEGANCDLRKWPYHLERNIASLTAGPKTPDGTGNKNLCHAKCCLTGAAGVIPADGVPHSPSRQGIPRAKCDSPACHAVCK